MAFDELMGLTNRFLSSAQALAAMSAHLRLAELGVVGDAAVRVQLDRVLDELGVREELDDLDAGERAVLLSFARSYLGQAVDLIEDPARASGWSHSDAVLLQAQGSASAVVATLISEAGLGSPGARILDVGVGVAGLATAFCKVFPDATVVGIDPWAPSLAIARVNVASAGLDSRVTLVETTIEEFEDAEGFDLVWLPSFFIPESVLDVAVTRVFELVRAGGTVVVGVAIADDTDPLMAAADDLFTVRSGGSVLDSVQAILRLERAGFADVHEVPRTWNPPLRFIVGRRA